MSKIQIKLTAKKADETKVLNFKVEVPNTFYAETDAMLATELNYSDLGSDFDGNVSDTIKNLIGEKIKEQFSVFAKINEDGSSEINLGADFTIDDEGALAVAEKPEPAPAPAAGAMLVELIHTSEGDPKRTITLHRNDDGALFFDADKTDAVVINGVAVKALKEGETWLMPRGLVFSLREFTESAYENRKTVRMNMDVTEPGADGKPSTEAKNVSGALARGFNLTDEGLVTADFVLADNDVVQEYVTELNEALGGTDDNVQVEFVQSADLSKTPSLIRQKLTVSSWFRNSTQSVTVAEITAAGDNLKVSPTFQNDRNAVHLWNVPGIARNLVVLLNAAVNVVRQNKDGSFTALNPSLQSGYGLLADVDGQKEVAPNTVHVHQRHAGSGIVRHNGAYRMAYPALDESGHIIQYEQRGGAIYANGAFLAYGSLQNEVLQDDEGRPAWHVSEHPLNRAESQRFLNADFAPVDGLEKVTLKDGATVHHSPAKTFMNEKQESKSKVVSGSFNLLGTLLYGKYFADRMSARIKARAEAKAPAHTLKVKGKIADLVAAYQTEKAKAENESATKKAKLRIKGYVRSFVDPLFYEHEKSYHGLKKDQKENLTSKWTKALLALDLSAVAAAKNALDEANKDKTKKDVTEEQTALDNAVNALDILPAEKNVALKHAARLAVTDHASDSYNRMKVRLRNVFRLTWFAGVVATVVSIVFMALFGAGILSTALFAPFTLLLTPLLALATSAWIFSPALLVSLVVLAALVTPPTLAVLSLLVSVPYHYFAETFLVRSVYTAFQESHFTRGMTYLGLASGGMLAAANVGLVLVGQLGLDISLGWLLTLSTTLSTFAGANVFAVVLATSLVSLGLVAGGAVALGVAGLALQGLYDAGMRAVFAFKVWRATKGAKPSAEAPLEVEENTKTEEHQFELDHQSTSVLVATSNDQQPLDVKLTAEQAEQQFKAELEFTPEMDAPVVE